MADSMMLLPCFSRCSTANSTRRIAFLVSRPMSMTRPIWPKTSSGMSYHQRPTMAPNMARGTVRMMTVGRIQLS